MLRGLTRALRRRLGGEPDLVGFEIEGLVPARLGRAVAIVGESFHNDTLHRLSGRRGMEQIDSTRRYTACLVPEFNNKHDVNAIKVTINNEEVGHLSRTDAVAYRPALLALFRRQRLGSCTARLFTREGVPNIGVWLDLAKPSSCVRKGGLPRSTVDREVGF